MCVLSGGAWGVGNFIGIAISFSSGMGSALEAQGKMPKLKKDIADEKAKLPSLTGDARKGAEEKIKRLEGELSSQPAQIASGWLQATDSALSYADAITNYVITAQNGATQAHIANIDSEIAELERQKELSLQLT